jgi:hypothetical protein
VGIADQNLKCSKVLTTYRNIAIFIFPLVAFAFYLANSLAYAQYNYDYINRIANSGKKTNISSGCSEIWNGLLVILSCVHLAFFLCQINKLKKSINTEHVNKETESKAEIRMGTTCLHILVLSALALNYFEVVILWLLPNYYLLVDYRAFTVQYFILGVQDIFVSFMLWFMMDSSNEPIYNEDLTTSRYSLGGQGNYRVLDVFMQVYGRRTSEINTEMIEPYFPEISNITEV